MNSNNSGGTDDEMRKKLTHIDKWLSSIVHAKDGTTVSSPMPQKQSGKQKTTKLVNKKNMNKPKQMNRLTSKPPRNKQRLHPSKQRKPKAIFSKNGLRIIPIGGLEEVGKNMMVFEYGKDILIVDMGFQFPTEDMLGIDYVLPDISYLEDKKDRIRGIFLTHGHLDHIGGLPYLLPKLNFPPVYGAPLTLGFVEKILTEFKQTKQAKLIKFDPKETFKVGPFGVSFFRVNHSIPDAVAVVINTPVGNIVHTGDWKFDFTPADQHPADYQEIATVGKKGIMVLISDSTNALEPGHTTTEKLIAENLDEIIRGAKGRLVVTSFSSLIGRLQQIIDSAVQSRRKIYLTGRSMLANIRIAQELGYIKVPKGILGDVRKMGKNVKDSECMILTTGSQGEDLSALARMAMGTHATIKIGRNDTVVLSSSPIIGNETSVVKLLNGLARRGAKIITNRETDVHTSGHAKQEDIKLMIKLIKPKFLIPVHGDYYMRLGHKEVAMSVGMKSEQVLLLDNGEVALLTPKGTCTPTGEKVPAKYIMVEGNERSLVEGHCLMDRQLMAENGAIVVLYKADIKKGKLLAPPRLVTRGFVYMNCSQDVIKKLTEAAQAGFEQYFNTHKKNVKPEEFLQYIQQHLDVKLNRIVDKRPLIVPIFT
jgi:ribonuclease J